MKVFLPYLTWNTVFDNTRVSRKWAEPVRFRTTVIPLLQFSRETISDIPIKPWPESGEKSGNSAGVQDDMMDFMLEAWVSGSSNRKNPWMMGQGEPWQPGEKLKLLFAGYNGTRNTGSDVRVEEMLRQIRRILGPKMSISA